MILRLFRAPIHNGREDELATFIRDQAGGRALDLVGLRAWRGGIRRAGPGAELLIVSTWAGFESIRHAWPESPLLAPDDAGILGPGRSEHFELVWDDVRDVSVPNGILRIARLPVQPRYEATYFSGLREAAANLLDREGLHGVTVGRQTIRGDVETIVITLWEDRAALDRAIAETGERGALFAALRPYHAGPIDIEEFATFDREGEARRSTRGRTRRVSVA